MKNNKKLRVSVREKFPETNSSSSHSVSISLSRNYYRPDEYNLNEIDADGTLFIPDAHEDFGWEFCKYNDVLTKIQYVSSIYSIKTNPKKLKLLKEIIKSFTGAKKVIFEFENRFAEEYKEAKENGDLEKDEERYCIENYGSSIDHNSFNIFPEILETKETIKDFIFNRDSWLFLGNDNSVIPDNFFITDAYKPNTIENNEPQAIASVDFGGEIGRIDFEITEFTSTEGILDKLRDSGDPIFSSIVIDKKTKKALRDYYTKQSNLTWQSIDNKDDNILTYFMFSKYYSLKTNIDGKIFIMYASNNFNSIFMEMVKKEKTNGITNAWEKVKNTMFNEDSLKDEYKLFEVHIKTKEFGELI